MINIFSDCFSFISVNQKNPEALVTHQNRLDNIYRNSLTNHDTMLIVLDMSVKNNVTTLILYICKGQEIIVKTIHHVINVTSSKAELFAIRCNINYATQLQDISHIIIITNAIPVARKISDLNIHP